MNANPMTEQVAKLVGNLLAGGEVVSLPGVGTLHVERQAARRIDRRHVVPPCRTVHFSSQLNGVSLVDEIARVLRVNGVKPQDPLPEAQKVYDRWLAQVREGDTLTIVGIGVLRFKSFRLDAAFDLRLNPQGHEPVLVRAPRRFDAVLWIGIAAIVCVTGFTAWWWFGERDQRQELYGTAVGRPEFGSDAGEPSCDAAIPADSSFGAMAGEAPVETERAGDTARTEAAGSVAADSGASAATLGSASATAAAGGNARAAAENVRTAERQSHGGPASLVSGRHYVVMGVFSTEKNARRAVREASSLEVAVTCGIYRFGAKLMVSPFESDDEEACRLFIRAHEERFPGMWIYTAR